MLNVIVYRHGQLGVECSKEVGVKGALEGVMLAGEPLIEQSRDDHLRFQAAKDANADAAEIERLRLIAESSFRAVTDYQLDALGHQRQTRY